MAVEMKSLPQLLPEEAAFYKRHLQLAQIGAEGQRRLKGASALVVGLGGLGCPAAQYLVASGVGRVTLLDGDVVEASNLQRQILYRMDDVGQKKVAVAAMSLQGLSPYCTIRGVEERLSEENALHVFREHDVIVDGSDNYPTRYLSNDAAFFAQRPLVYGAIHQFSGQVAVFDAHEGAGCYRCLLPEPPVGNALPNCSEIGVLGVLPGVVGSLQGMEAIKLLLGLSKGPKGRLLHYEALKSRFSTIELKPDEGCALCGRLPTIKTIKETGMDCSHNLDSTTWTVEEFRLKLADGWNKLILDVRQPEEFALGNIEGSKLLPLGVLRERLDELKGLQEEEFLVYCQAGKRSAVALQILHEAGFTKACHLGGGYAAWKESPSSSL